MTTSHVPERPTEEVLSLVRKRWLIDTTAGTVWSKNSPGRQLGAVDYNGYREVQVRMQDDARKRIRVSHLVWWTHYGVWPSQELDHIDKNRLNDSITNLREATEQCLTVSRHKTRGSSSQSRVIGD